MTSILPAVVTASGTITAAAVAVVSVLVHRRRDSRSERRQQVLTLIGEQLRKAEDSGSAADGRVLAFTLMQVAPKDALRAWLHEPDPRRAVLALSQLLLDVINEDRRSMRLERLDMNDATVTLIGVISERLTRAKRHDAYSVPISAWWVVGDTSELLAAHNGHVPASEATQ